MHSHARLTSLPLTLLALATLAACGGAPAGAADAGPEPDAPAPAALAIQIAGAGTVTSAPAGIACGAACDATFPRGTVVTLTATPAPGARFVGWSGGGCAGTATCAMTLEADVVVTATFAAACTDACAAGASRCASGASVETCGQHDADACLEWGPATSCGDGATCVGTACVPGIALTTTAAGPGQITSTPAGIACGAACSASFPRGTAVHLTATPTPGATFTGWSGACAGTAACDVVLDAPTAVTATFGAACPETTCQATTLAFEWGGFTGLAIDATHAYWSVWNSDDGVNVVRRVPLAGGPAEDFATAQARPSELVVDADYLYWGSEAAYAVRRRAKAGGPVEVLATQLLAGAKAWDGAAVYGTILGLSPGLWRSSSAGTTHLTNVSEPPSGIAVDATDVYLPQPTAGVVVRWRKATGQLTTVITGVPGVSGVALDATYAYLTNTTDGTIRRWPKAGGSLTTLITGDVSTRRPIIDGSRLYWAAGNTLRTMPTTAGGVATTLANGGFTTAIQVDDRYLYWAGGDYLFRTSKCACGL